MRISDCDLSYYILPLAIKQNKNEERYKKRIPSKRMPYNKGDTSRTYSWEAEPNSSIVLSVHGIGSWQHVFRHTCFRIMQSEVYQLPEKASKQIYLNVTNTSSD